MLLADQLLSSGVLRAASEDLHISLEKSQKFLLSKDAEQLFRKFHLGITLESRNDFYRFSRVPFPYTWIELETVERSKNLNCGYLFGVGNPQGTKYGCLYISHEVSEMDYVVWPMEVQIEIPTVTNGFNLTWNTRKIFDVPDYSEETNLFVSSKVMTGSASLLAMLNCKNLFEETEVSHPAALQKSRIKRGRLPRCEHKILDLGLTRGQRNSAIDSGMSETELRQHLVRGHFKRRSSGLYWWSPYLRGNPEIGHVHRDLTNVTAKEKFSLPVKFPSCFKEIQDD